MTAVEACGLPPHALLARYAKNGGYTDCFAAELARKVSLAEYVGAFYTTRLFRLERYILTYMVSLPSTDREIEALAAGTRDGFAAWKVEGRAIDQLLLADLRGRTRSWLMVAPGAGTDAVAGAAPTRTRLYFGSAIVPEVDATTGRARIGTSFRLLKGFHVAYSRALLRSARARLEEATG